MMETAVTADVITVNKTEEGAADPTPPPVKPPAQRTRRRATNTPAPAARRSQRVKRRGNVGKRRGTGEKRRGQKDKKRGQEEAEGVTVKRTWSGGKRRWDKKHYCVFCRRPQVKIARHLLRKHGDQQEVVAASALPTGSKPRHLLLEHLRCRGNYLHNIEVGLVPLGGPSAEPLSDWLSLSPGDPAGQRRDRPVPAALGGGGRPELPALPALPRLLPPSRPLEAPGLLSQEVGL